MNSSGSTPRSASKPKLCGAIFDAPAKKIQFDKTEQEISDPNFWNNSERSQKLMQDRKRLEMAIQQDARVSGMVSDIDTLFELGREGEKVEAELARDLKKLSGVVGDLETGMLLAGEHDKLSAIVTIHPGAGGTESQDGAELLLRM